MTTPAKPPAPAKAPAAPTPAAPLTIPDLRRHIDALGRFATQAAAQLFRLEQEPDREKRAEIGRAALVYACTILKYTPLWIEAVSGRLPDAPGPVAKTLSTWGIAITIAAATMYGAAFSAKGTGNQDQIEAVLDTLATLWKAAEGAKRAVLKSGVESLPDDIRL